MAKVAVVYHSGYGHTKVVAEHVAKGVTAGGASVTVFTVDEATARMGELAGYDAIVFGSPTYMGGYSAPFKAFVDAASKVWFAQGWKDKIAAGFTNSGSLSGDKLNTLQSMFFNAMQHSMIWVGTGLMPGTDHPEGINRISSSSGLMTQSNTKESAETAPPESDRKTAELFGKRIAEVTKRWMGEK